MVLTAVFYEASKYGTLSCCDSNWLVLATWFVEIFVYKFTVKKQSFHIYSCKSTWVVWSVHGLWVWSVLGALSRFESRLGSWKFLYTTLQSRKADFIYLVAKAHWLYEASMGCQGTAGSKQSPGLATIFAYKFQVKIFQRVHIVTKMSICYEASMERLDNSDSELIIYYIWFIDCLQILYVDFITFCICW